MRLNKQVSNFSASCEHLIAEAETSGRQLTEEESLLVEYYCREVLKKVIRRPPSREEKHSSETSHGHSDNPPDPTNSSAVACGQTDGSRRTGRCYHTLG
jgi:hypothetical protein